MLESSRLAALCAVPTLMLIMAWITVMLRCWVKKKILKTFMLDDWFMLLSLAFLTVMVGLQYRKTALALGQHTYDLSPAQLVEFFHLFFVGQIVYILLTVFIKISISIFLLRISIERVHKVVIYATLFIYVSTSIYFIISIILQCSPTAFFWDKSIAGGTCVSNTQELINSVTGAALTTSTDLIYSLLPLWLIRNLKMDFKNKLSVAVILSLGLISTAATCVRFRYIVPLNISADFTYDVYGIEIWSTIEPGLGITAASAATLRPLLRIITSRMGLGTKERASVEGQHQQLSSNKRVSPTFANALRGHIRSSSARETELNPGIPASASFVKLWPQESISTISDADNVEPRVRQRSVVLEHAWPDEK